MVCGSIGFAQGGAPEHRPAGGRGRAPRRTVILEQAPKDHSIAIPKDKLAQYLKDMDAKKLQTLRMIEGGKYNVNIRRITAAETGLVHPITADLWVVLEGGGTLTTGGVLENGKINGGQSRKIKVGDVVYIPSGLPHGVSGVEQQHHVAQRAMGHGLAGRCPDGRRDLNGLLGRARVARAPAGRLREGSVDARAARAGAAGAAPRRCTGGARAGVTAWEPADAALQLWRQRRAVLLEGATRSDHGGDAAEEVGQHTADRRRALQREPALERHADRGAARADDRHVVRAGGRCDGQHRIPGERRRARAEHRRLGDARPGDVFFHPSNFYHGFSQTTPDIFWLNIRWDDNYAKRLAPAPAVC